MNDTTITIRGNAGSIPELRTSATGTVWTSFRLASTSRRRSPDGGWEDKATLWVSVTVFRALAERVAATVRKGTPLTIVGDLSHEEWVTQDGSPRSGPAVIARSVAVDLAGGKVTWTRPEPPSGGDSEAAHGDGDRAYDGPGEPEEVGHGAPRDVSGLTVVGAAGTDGTISGGVSGSAGGDGPPF